MASVPISRPISAVVDGGATEYPGSVKGVGHTRGLADLVFHAFHATHGNPELLAHHGVGAGNHGAVAYTADTGGRQGHHASTRQGFHEHLPAHAGVFHATQHIAGRHDHITADNGAVGEVFTDGLVVVADVQAFSALGAFFNQYHGDARLFTLAQQVLRIVQAHGQGNQVGHRRQSDIALAEIQLEFHFAVIVLEHYPFRFQGGRVGTRSGFGEAEARNEITLGQLGQIVVLLLIGAVVTEQLCGAQGIGNHHHGAEQAGVGADLGHDAGFRLGGHGHAAVFLGDLHGKEAIVGHELEDIVRQLAGTGQLIAVGHLQQLFHRAVQERLFVGGELVIVFGEDFFKVHLAAEELTINPYIAGFQGLAFGVGNLRENLVVPHPVHHLLKHAVVPLRLLGPAGQDERLRARTNKRRTLTGKSVVSFSPFLSIAEPV